MGYCLSKSEHQMLEVTSIKEVTNSFNSSNGENLFTVTKPLVEDASYIK